MIPPRRAARVIAVELDRPDPAAIEEAARVVRAGGIVAFATETLYGLGVDPRNARAVERLFTAKERPEEKGVPIVVGELESVVAVASEIPPGAWPLVARHWPGPLTLVLRARAMLPRGVEREGGVAVRWTSSPIAAALARAAGGAVTATSANRSGDPVPPLDPADLLRALGSEIDLLLDAGKLPPSLASTVVDARFDTLRVLRRGAVDLGGQHDAHPGLES